MTDKLSYAYLDEAPVLFNEAEAWHCVGGRWQRLHIADAHCKAKLLSRAEYHSMFGSDRLPSLPTSAFNGLAC